MRQLQLVGGGTAGLHRALQHNAATNITAAAATANATAAAPLTEEPVSFSAVVPLVEEPVPTVDSFSAAGVDEPDSTPTIPLVTVASRIALANAASSKKNSKATWK